MKIKERRKGKPAKASPKAAPRVASTRAKKPAAVKQVGPSRPASPPGKRRPRARAQESGPGADQPLEPEVVDLEAPAEPEVLPPEPEVVLPADAESEDADESPAGPLPLEGGDAGASPSPALPVPIERDLAHADALRRYLAEVSRHPLLSREEEHRLAVEFTRTRAPAVAWRLVTANLRLVVKIANEYRRAAFNVLDLIQEGNVGLMQAVQKYDPFRGVKLSSYAAWWIRAYIIRYLMDNWRMVKLGTTQAQRKLFFNLRKEQQRLLAEGFEAAPKLLAERLDVSEQDVREMDQRLGNDELSLDAPLQGGSDESRQTYLDRLGDGGKGAEEQLGDEELRRVLKEKLAAFAGTLTSDKDRFLFEHRIAVPEGTEPMTLQEVGEKYGFTRERARQLEARLTDRLRDFLRRELPDFAQLSVNPPGEGE